MSKKSFLKGTLILTLAGLCTRFIGFFYRIFLSHAIGAQGMGLYQLVIPVQMTAMAVAASGIHTAISRLCAAKAALENQKRTLDIFLVGTFLSLGLSLLLAWLSWRHADFLAVQILKEPRTASLIRLLSLTFPLNAVHTCVNSYYFSRKQTEIPSAIQLLEQGVRVGGCYLVYRIFVFEGRALTPVIAVAGTLAGEAAACLASLFAIGLLFRKVQYTCRELARPGQIARSIGKMAAPLSLNRLLLNLLSSMEVILIPQMLLRFGLSSEEALSIYGIFTGMALPLILFPSALTNSAAVMLMPSVAQLQALGNQKRIRRILSQACRWCLALGLACTLGFLLFGEAFGSLLFKNAAAGAYIRALAFLCPFLYLNTTLTSVLNGMGKAGACLAHNLTCVLLRIWFVVMLIPHLGIRAYFYGLLCSQILLAALQIATLAFLLSLKEPKQL